MECHFFGFAHVSQLATICMCCILHTMPGIFVQLNLELRQQGTSFTTKILYFGGLLGGSSQVVSGYHGDRNSPNYCCSPSKWPNFMAYP